MRPKIEMPISLRPRYAIPIVQDPGLWREQECHLFDLGALVDRVL
jgi:hypothetical protein